MNLPNKLSTLRIILIPFMVFFYLASFLGPWGKFAAFVIFIAAAITDRLDGKIARQTNQVTDLGKLLDPIADKMLYNTGLILVVCDGTIPAPYGVIGLLILLCRDFAIDGLRQVAATKGVVVAAVRSGKLKAIFHYIHIPMFMLYAGLTAFEGEFWNIFNQVIFYSALAIFAVATIITIWSLIDYFMKNKKVIFGEKQKQDEEK